LAGTKKGEVQMENKEMEEVDKKRRRIKNQKQEYVINRDRCKFYVDLSEDKAMTDLIFAFLEKANNKEHGREITFKDLVILAIPRLIEKDIERLQEMSLSEMEKVERALKEFNTKHGLNLTMGEFLVKKLNIN
jgi:hypothetical protein